MLRETFPVGPLSCNCTILADAASHEALVIDPGGDFDRINAVLTRESLRVVGIVHTHAHIDHVGATAELSRTTGALAYLHEGDVFLHDMLAVQAQLLGIAMPEKAAMQGRLQDGAALRFGAHELGVVHTPGHTPGSVCFVSGELCLSGDTLFRGGVGRTDLWGGDSDALERSIKDRLYSLNGAVEVVPGHGPSTTIDRERRQNAYVRA